MNINNKYKFVFDEAKGFLGEIIKCNPALSDVVLKQHLQHQSKFEDITDANKRLVESLTNRNMMLSVIDMKKNEATISSLLFGFDPFKILNEFSDSNKLFSVFQNNFKINNAESNRNLWKKFSDGILSGSRFLSSFKSKNEFNEFIENFSLNKYTKAALPMLLSKEIDGFGFALSCDFLKELGYRDYPKPDVHLIKIFHELGLANSTNDYEVYKSIVEMSEIVGEDAYTIDKIFWLISSGKFYLVGIDTGRNRDLFIETVRSKMMLNNNLK